MKGKKAVAAGEPPKKRKMPDMSGVPGEVVSLDGLGLEWGTRARKSPYDPLLDELAAAGTGKGLRFGDTRARTALAARAKKKGLRISFAESGGALFVRLDGRVEDDVRATRREQIKTGLKVSGGATPMALTKLLRDKGDANIGVNLVEAILGQMLRAGEVIQQEGGTWRLPPTRRAA